ncbi:MAG TPA: hypothetical protein VIF15_12135 [Polyangiaceae bacterium]|jgi:hypothetical protein
MRVSLRVHSVLGLAVFLGWSLLVNARERFAPQRAPATPQRTTPLAQRIPPPATDPRMWN